jgi:cytidine deaminase
MTSDELVAVARSSRQHSHAPYSQFRAGAAVRTRSGDEVPGVIVENVSLGLAMCAERVALFSTVARGDTPAAVALVAPRTGEELTWPCGACLQVALELGGPDMAIYVGSLDEDAPVSESTVGQLLPRGPFVRR